MFCFFQREFIYCFFYLVKQKFPRFFDTAADNYGLQFAGYVHPPATGDYAFFIAADDTAALYLSPDANPANKALLATVPAKTPASRDASPITKERETRFIYHLIVPATGSGRSRNLRRRSF